jgi:two-component system, cell cycle response regulator
MKNPETRRLVDMQRSLAASRIGDTHADLYLILLTGAIPGALIGLEPSGVRLGRAVDNTIQVSDESVSRYHAFLWSDEQGRAWFTDLGSTNGSYLNGLPTPGHTSVRLRNGDQVQFGLRVTVKFVELNEREAECQRSLYERAVRDALTGLHNRAYFLDQLQPLADRGASVNLGLAVMMVDIDHFKRVNDTYGHDAGDLVLRKVASVLMEATRRGDMVARYGGEEFIVAISIPAPGQARLVAERIRSSLAACELSYDGDTVRVTASIGVAYAPLLDPSPVNLLIDVSDRAMYQAKAAGRDRVVVIATPVSDAAAPPPRVPLSRTVDAALPIHN